MYPNTVFEIVDNSNITVPVDQIAVEDKPVFLAVFTSDKGSEEYGLYTADNFASQFGEISFAKHGQPLLQAAMTVNAGAALYCKRCVAEDATLANLVLCATVGESGITYEFKTVESTKTLTDVIAEAKKLVTDTVLPIAVFVDNGRGLSKKSLRIEPDYRNSKSVDYVRYSLYVAEGNTELEALGFALDPEIIYNDANVSLGSVVSRKSTQIKCHVFESNIETLYEKVSTLLVASDSTMTVDNVRKQDLLFGKTKEGEAIAGLTSNLDSTKAYTLLSGTNGSLGNRPVESESYETVLLSAFSDEYREIYDIDNMKLDAIVDANYPDKVKLAIAKVVDFREDAMYLRDLGTNDGLGYGSLSDVVTRFGATITIEEGSEEEVFPHSKFITTYHNSYDILDPYSKKQITVTVCYDLAQKLVSHMLKGAGLPFAGQLHDMVFPDIIDGTINFIPVDLPGQEKSEKETLADLRINYISYYDGLATMETNYTSYDKYTDLSYINNVMAIQKIIKAIRRKCPKIRYSFLNGEDFNKYQSDVQAVIDREGSSFSNIKLVYYADDRYESNGIYYAGLEVKCKKFIQTEYFKVTVL